LAHNAFGVPEPLSAIERRGIDEVDPLDVRFAGELGYVIKLLAEAFVLEGQLALHVSPVLLKRAAPLALVRGAYNAILVVGDAVGDTLFYGQGAGQMPTASAVTADLIDLAIGRSQRTFQTLRLWTANGARAQLRSPATVKTRFYLRLLVDDRPGVLAEVTGVLARHQISIASVIQHEAPDEEEGTRVQLVIMTHTSLTGAFRSAAADMGRLGCVAAPAVYYPVAD
ncbi:MAG TPA: ACT domain-containing protein, partial [Gemmataceae bacterium]|nr:ACT domain-containing protein [Gemmataceae bacterium]